MMNEQNNKTVSAKPLFQTIVFCLFSLASAVCLGNGLFLAGLLCLMITSGILSLLFFSCPKGFAALDILAMLAILFVAGGFQFVSLIYGAAAVIVAVILTRKVRQHKDKSSATLVCTAVLAVIAIAALFVWYLASGNEFSLSAMQGVIDDAFEQLHAMMETLVRETYAMLPPETVAIYEASGVSLSDLIDAALDNVTEGVLLVKMILPGILLFALQVFAYFAVTAFQTATVLSYGVGKFFGAEWAIYPTRTTCVIFMVTASLYALLSIFVSSTALFMVLVLNMLLTVMPSMLASGAHCLRLRFRNPYMKTKTLVITIIIVIGCVVMPTYVLPVAALLLGFVGAQDIFTIRTLSEQKERMENGEDDDDYLD